MVTWLPSVSFSTSLPMTAVPERNLWRLWASEKLFVTVRLRFLMLHGAVARPPTLLFGDPRKLWLLTVPRKRARFGGRVRQQKVQGCV